MSIDVRDNESFQTGACTPVNYAAPKNAEDEKLLTCHIMGVLKRVVGEVFRSYT
jgi:hypothetical protein